MSQPLRKPQPPNLPTGTSPIRGPQLDPSKRPMVRKHHHESSDYSQHPPAGMGIRFLALVIDGVFLSIIGKVIEMGIAVTGMQDIAIQSPQLFQIIAGAVITTLYAAVPTHLWGGTLGKKLLKLRVIRLDGSTNISFLRAFSREYIGKVLSLATLMIGYLIAGLNQNRRALHDFVANTRVVRD